MTFEDFCGWYGLESYEDTLLSQREICIEAWTAAVEQTRQACFEAVCNQCAEGKGKGCNVCFLKSAIMQAEVE